MITFERILVLAPHTDDAELGCGASIARFAEEGVEVAVAAFSTAEESLPPGEPSSLLHDEFMVAMRILGIEPARTHVFTYPVRKLSYHRQEVLEDLMRLRAKYEPELVLAPSRSDLHQDHQVLHAESLRAFKDGSIWGYELPWNNIEFAATAFVKIEERHLAKKWAALQAYQSQLTLGRLYFCKQFIDGLARVRGVQVKTPFAEAFDLTRIKI